MNEKKKWGRFFTSNSLLLNNISNLIYNNDNILEPCCGIGHIIKKLELKYNNIYGIDIIKDNKICQTTINYLNFFDYDTLNKFGSIITNPPYVSYRIFDNTILNNWNTILPKTNLYLYFIEKSFFHLKPHGELIFIVPIDFINNERGKKLRQLLFNNGTITHIINLSDKKLFTDCSPDVIIFRYEKDNYSHIINYQVQLDSPILQIKEELHNFSYNFISFTNFKYIKDFFNIKVGIVSGSNKVFNKESRLSVSIMLSDFINTNQLHKFLFIDNFSLDQLKNSYLDIYNYIIQYKDILYKRKVRKITEKNWWKWGGARNIQYMTGDLDCIFVNQRTRVDKPFFIHKQCYYDGSMLCMIPKEGTDINKWIDILNNNKDLFKNHGLLVNNKYMLNKIKLENMKIPYNLI